MAGEQNGQVKGVRERGNRSLRFFDRYFGIPLVLLLGLLRKKRECPQIIDRIAILKTAAIGDTVLISAIIKDIRQAWPKALITFFCGSSNHEMARMLDTVDEVIRIPVARPFTALKMMRGGYDLLMDFGQWPRLDALLAGLSGASYTIGFNTRGQYRHYLYDAAIHHDDRRHELDNFRALLAPLGIEGKSLPDIPHVRRNRRSGRVVLHMFAGGLGAHQKAWPEEHWLQLMEALLAKDCRLVLSGSVENRPHAQQMASRVSRPECVSVAAGELNLLGLVELLSEASLLITVNTGVMHLAASLDCPLIALNGPTAVQRWGPVGAGAISLQSPRACSPCVNLGFEFACPNNLCMSDIDVAAVLEVCERMQASG